MILGGIWHWKKVWKPECYIDLSCDRWVWLCSDSEVHGYQINYIQSKSTDAIFSVPLLSYFLYISFHFAFVGQHKLVYDFSKIWNEPSLLTVLCISSFSCGHAVVHCTLVRSIWCPAMHRGEAEWQKVHLHYGVRQRGHPWLWDTMA